MNISSNPAHKFSIRARILSGLIATLVVVTAGLAATNWVLSSQYIEQRVARDLPIELAQIKDNIEQQITSLQNVARQLASSAMAQQMLNDGKDPETEIRLVKELESIRQAHQLQAASFCDRTTGDYWNERGFLRRLTPEQDAWFFAFKESGQETQVSVYNSEEVGYQIFVNYQQPNGKGLSGVAKSLDDMVAMIGDFRIQETGFVFLVGPDGKVVIHPEQKIGTALQGFLPPNIAENLTTLKDGEVYRQSINNKDYLWVSVQMPSTGWKLIGQIPAEEFYVSLYHVQSRMLMMAVLIAVMGLLFAIWLSKSITRPINRIADVFSQLSGKEADLSSRIELRYSEELNQLAEGFNQFVHKLAALITKIRANAAELTLHAQHLNKQAEQSVRSNSFQYTVGEQVQDSMEQMHQTVQEIAKNAARTASTTQETNHSTKTALSKVQTSQDALTQLASDMDVVGGTVGVLSTKTSDITLILDVIYNVSEQTNLLALNAAIEAARAGEQGRGFAVVADEVRSLASRTKNSANEIHQLIKSLVEQTEVAVTAVGKAVEKADVSVQGTEATFGELASIGLQINSLQQMNEQVAAATEEQSLVSQDISKQVRQMSEGFRDSVDEANLVKNSAEELSRLASELSALTTQFRL
jgi:methyl-accepting chemotaxis protein